MQRPEFNRSGQPEIVDFYFFNELIFLNFLKQPG